MESAYKVDLTNCDKEPIHIPGFIQSHGFLLALNTSSYEIESASENTTHYLGKTPAQLLGKKITEVFEAENAAFLAELLSIGKRAGSYDAQNPATMITSEKAFDVIIHKFKNRIIIEFELQDKNHNVANLHKIMTSALGKIQSASSLQKLLDNVAVLVKDIIGYDRVMVYKFHEDGHGEVVAEARNEEVDSFMHLHYPASDIPVQARQLYKENLVRIIADVNSIPSPLLALDQENVQPLDLTHSVLRAVSPIHIEYLKNMGVAASFSISLVYKDQLWGLIACHNYTPKIIDYNSRMACKFVGQLFSSSLEFRMEEDTKEEQTRFREAEYTLYEQMAEDLNIPDALINKPVTLMDTNNATGAALCLDDKIYLLGKTPTETQIRDIARFANENRLTSMFETSHLGALIADASVYAEVASGVLISEISAGFNEYVIWFKPERILTVDWAGNPQKQVNTDINGQERISPRKSFEKWTTEVRNTSTEWSAAEINTAVKLREDIIQILNKKSNEIRKLNELLRIAYEELDTFTYTISHDLTTPLSSIKNYTEILLEDHGHELSDDASDIFKKVIKGADKMAQLIKDVLHYSKVGRAGITFTQLDMPTLIQEASDEITASYASSNINFEVENPLNIAGDKTMISQVFQNLLGNAVKYSSNRHTSEVKITAKENGDNFVLYIIEDNGIGLDMRYASRVFELFRRLNNVKNIEGTGVGLAIVKRIVEKHGGKIWVESVLNEGTKFYLTLPKEVRND